MKATFLALLVGLITCTIYADSPFDDELQKALKEAPLIDFPKEPQYLQRKSISVIEIRQNQEILDPKFDINTSPAELLRITK